MNALELVKILEKRFSDVLLGTDSIYLASGALDPREAGRILRNSENDAYEAVRKLVRKF